MVFRTPPRLKRLPVIIGVLLLLLAGICFQPWALWDAVPPREAISRADERITRSSRVREPAPSSGDLSESASTEPESGAGDPPSSSPGEPAAAQVRPRAGGAASGRLPSQIYYIRSHSLLTSRVEGLSRASAVEMLEQAVAQVASGFPEEILVFDAEGEGRSRGRFVVHAKPGYDLTDEVAAAFDQLQAQQRRQSASRKTGN